VRIRLTRRHLSAHASGGYDAPVSDILILLIIGLVVVLFIRGPKMLPKLGEALGRGVKETRAELDRGANADDPTDVPPAPPAPPA